MNSLNKKFRAEIENKNNRIRELELLVQDLSAHLEFSVKSEFRLVKN